MLVHKKFDFQFFQDHILEHTFATCKQLCSPASDPEIAVAVILEHAGAGGGTVAAPIAQKVLARYFEKHPVVEMEGVTVAAD